MFDLITKFISISDWLRIALVYGHVLVCAFAITAVLRTDLKIVFGNICEQEIARAAKEISFLLAALWVSGLAIIYIDTGFSAAILATKPKLLLKLMCVVTLTLNGIALHNISFPVLTRLHGIFTPRESILLVVTGALSTSHWMLAAFIGMSQPLGRLPLQTLFTGYGLFVLAVVTCSLPLIPLLPGSKLNVYEPKLLRYR